MQEKLDLFSSAELRDEGIKQALDHANEETPKWSEIAYQFLIGYTKTHKIFMTEEVRAAAEIKIPLPPSKRAWGGVIVKAVKSQLIKRNGFKNVKNAKAHCTPASVWEVV